ncbi:MAG TPA: hypothetical protein VEA38_14390 [Terriglobales bacterium]|nr:hypothetical protein [Terriglobales bacterium]
MKRGKKAAKWEPIQIAWAKTAIDWTLPENVRRGVAEMPDDLMAAIGRVESERAILRWLVMERYHAAATTKTTTSTWTLAVASKKTPRPKGAR